MSQYILAKLPIVSQVLCYYNGNLFTKTNGTSGLYSINITTGQYTAINSAMVQTIGGQNIYNLATYNNCIYFIEFNSLYKQNISTGIVTTEINNNANMKCGWRYIITCVYGSYIYYMASDIPCIGRVNLDTLAIEGSWSGSNSNYNFNAIVGYNNYLYFDNAVSSINRINVDLPTDVSLNFITSLPSTVTGLAIANNSLFVSTANNQIQRYGLSTPATNKSVPFATSSTISYAGTNYSTLNGNWSIVAVNQSLYVINVTSAGVITKIDLPLQYNPYPTITFDTGNTITVSSGNLKVSIIDPSNTLANGVYYQYAVNNNVYTTTGINAGNSPYTFYIAPTSPPLDISNTIYVIASNPVGDSTPAANIQVIVYQKPRPPPKMTLQLVQNGNIQITIIESASTPIPYYYLNNVSYYCYAYNTFGGQNLSGNTSLLVYNRPIGILSNTNVTYGNVVSYINTGLTANTYTMYVIAVNQFGNSTPVSGNINVYFTPSNISFDTGNTSIGVAGNLKVTIYDPNNLSTNGGIYYFYSVNGGATYANSGVPNNGPTKTSYTFYILYNPLAIQTIYVRAQNTLGNSNIIGVNVNSPYNTSLYNTTTPRQFFIDNSTNYAFQATGFPNKTYNLYLRGKNITGYSANSVPYSVTVFVSPIASINIVAGNTKTVAAGNLQVQITDLSNTALNGVYYWYSLNNNVDASFANTFVRANVSPYSFFVPSVRDISNTLYVRATNQIGNSSPAANLPVIVYQTPTQPQVQYQLIGSGNVQVSISEPSPIPYYYLNNVSYSLYAYNNANGNNLSGNTSLAIYNRSVGILSNTNSTYANVVSYVTTGLNANTYTMYVIATNPFGNSAPVSSNIAVYTTPDFPPKIDASNTLSSTSGNLTVAFTDLSNNTRNAIWYVYYVYDPSGTNNSGNVAYYSNTNLTLTTGTQQSFSVNGTGLINKTYTVYLRSVNPVGNSVTASFANVLVYTVPTDISIDTANVKTVASGNLQVVIVDPTNGTNNGVYYQYSVIGVNANAWVNANAVSIGASTSYRFYISGLTNQTYTINVKAQNTVGNSNASTFIKTVYITPQYPPTIDTVNTISSASGNLTISFTDTQNQVLNDISYSYYLFDVSSGGSNQWSNTLAYTESPNKLVNGTTQYSFQVYGYPNKKYALYLTSKNSIGYSANTAPYNVTVFTTPFSTINIDAGNTKTVASGNLQVRITDLSNTSLNNVYYQYSMNGNAYANTNVFAGTPPSSYTFYIAPANPPLDISNTVYVRASNTVGNSSPTASFPVIVYQTPRTPPSISFQLMGSGNVQVSITETSPIPFYYLNNVSYSLYAYNNANGNNLSGNTSLAIYNRPVGVLANTNSSYGNVVSYVTTGLTANTYTMYVIATNPFGNSSPVSANIVVYTTPDFPPKIDASNTLSSTSGNLTVSFTDLSNNTRNAIWYVYYVYDPSGTNNSGNVAYYSNTNLTLTTGTQQSFSVNGTGLINKTYTVYLRSVNPVGNSVTASFANVLVYTIPTDISIDLDNTSSISSGNLQVTVVDSYNGTNNGVYYQYLVTGSTIYANAVNTQVIDSTKRRFVIPNLPNGSLRVYVMARNTVGNSNPTYFDQVTYVNPDGVPVIDVSNTLSSSSGNLTVTFTDASNVALNNVTYYYYLYDISAGGTNYYANTYYYTTSSVKLQENQTQYSFPITTGLGNNTYTLYLKANNNVGWSGNSTPYTVKTYTTPLATVSFDAGNTKTVASGNLKVVIRDPSNIAFNGVSYQYSINGTTYIRSNVIAGTSPYSFYIAPTNPILDISSTIYVRATNQVGNSSPEANLPVVVYRTPRTPPSIQFQLMSSGNVQVTIIETPDSRPDYYYLNNVSYSLYAYNNANGTNLSGNTSLSIYNRPVGILSNTNSTYANIVSYVSTGLTANTYTMYVIATNPFGNSAPFSANIVVYTTPNFPPTIDAENTISSSSGNLTVSFTDPFNNPRNAISYWYYVYDPSGTNNFVDFEVYSNTNLTLTTGQRQSFTLYGYTNKTYTLYLRSVNPVKSSSPSSINVTVYTVPTNIAIDTANVKTVASGNLQVVLVDPSNGTNNGVYYQYSVIGVNGNAWTNANAVSIDASTSYRFYISTGLTNQTYTINVRAQNTVGNSNPATFSKTVYITPQYPPTTDTGNTLSTSSGNLTISFTDTQNAVLNDISYSYYLYDISAGGTNQSSNLLAYIESPNKLIDGQTLYSFGLSGFPNKTYTLYLRSKNSIGYSTNTEPYNVTVFTTPFATVLFDDINTKTVASGNLQVALVDPSNTSLNQVYYWYSTTTDTDEAYSNTYVKSEESALLPYRFYISPQLDISSTIYIKAVNTVGNSYPAINKQVIVYQTPLIPTDIQFDLVSSGNVQVTITESPDSVPNYYYLNNVSYYLYAYNHNSSETGLDGNISSYTYPVGALTSTNTRYNPIVSYVNTGLTANAHTMFVVARNDFGYSSSFSSNIDVYTTPLRPIINTQTTVSATSGNLTVSFADTANNVYNGIEYLYYMYDISAGGFNDSGNVFAYIESGRTLFTGGTEQSFDIYGYTNKIYTLYLLAKNPVGTSVADSTNVIVYTNPLTPTYYDIGNTRTVSSGNLQVAFYDTVNPSLNNVYYWYSTDNGYSYSPSYVKNTGSIDPYVFFISPLNTIRTNISIISTDPVGNSAPLTQTFTVLQTPRTPPEVSATLVQSGNVLLTVRESATTPPDNYFMNNVSYYYYLYTEDTGDNLSGDVSAYTNYIGSATDPNYSDISIYVTGLPNKTSTFYVMAINDVGNSASKSADITVYVAPNTPPAFDDENTYTVASGNLQVRLIDTTNTATNNAYYWYSMDGGNTYIPTNVKNNGPATSSYTFYIPDLSNQDYTVSVIAKNTVGYSPANTITKRVYMTPQFAPIIDRANSRSYSANHLTVAFDDTRNNVANDIRYLYYLYDTATSNDNNMSGNVAYYTESAISLLLDGTTRYSFDVSGLANTTYTLYLLSKNTVGISSTDSTNVVVYTIPAIPAIDVSNTFSVASGNLQITIIDTSNVSLNNVYYWYSINGGNTFANTNIKNIGPSGSPYVFYVAGLQNQTNTLAIMAQNTVGNVVSGSLDVVSYTKPFPVQFDASNTYSVASGNLQVTVIDTSNISLNEVYYKYSIDGGISYANTDIKNVGPAGSPYVFWIPDLSNQTYTVSVKSVNRIDESVVSTITKMVYVAPEYSPTLDLGNTISATSGNLTVAFDDTSNRPTNAIQYWYYLYDPSSNTVNEWANTRAYTDTAQSLATAGTGPTHFTFRLSNLTNKTYTIYLLSKNTVGTSLVPVYANTIVYTTPVNPPVIDTANTRTVATGNLLVSFTDIVNESLNDVYYWYSTNGGSSYLNSLVKNAGPAQSAYSFYISGLTNANTTLSMYSKNTVGNSIPSTKTIKVYTTPLPIQTIQSGNTKTVASGNLQVTFVDPTNMATNDVYYWYSTYSSVDGWSVFANSLVKNAGPAKSTYMFYINGLTNSHTKISIKSCNSTDLYIGESTSVSANVIVYTTPEPASSYSISTNVSGNIQIDVVDTNNSPTNQVYYYVYYYRTGDTGQNNSANISAYSNTYTKRIVSSTATSFYLNDLSNNQYTVYLATKNDFGSNLFSPALPPIQVYTTPLVPAIDNANTLSKSSGNLTVSIVDMVNLPTNAVYYWYSINGGVYGNTGISKLSGVSRYSYDIPTTQISNGNTYIVRIRTVNPIGQSATVATSNPTEVYTTPEIPVLYSVVAQDTAIDVAFSTPYNNGNAITRYEYILNGSSVGTLHTTLVNSQNTARISGLINSIQYSVGVRAVNARGSSGLSSTQSTIPFGVPFIPDVNVVSSNNSLDIYFTTPNDNGNAISRYEYSLYGGSLSYPINTISLASNNHYTETNVTNGIQYSVVVRAVNARGAGAWSTMVSATPYTNPGAPIVKLESLTGAFRIYFDTPYNGGVPITYYQYEVNESGNYTQFIGTDSNNSFIVSGVDGTPYTIRVRTFNTNNRISEWSLPVSVTPFSIPDSPVLRTAEAGIGTIPISFSASTYNGGNTITRYEYSTNNGNSFATMGLPTTVNENGYITYEITYQSINGSVPLVNGTPYTIRLRAVNARGPSTSFSGSITVIPFNRPDPPTIDSVTPSNHIITILFSAPVSDGGSAIISYEYSINGGANYDTIPSIDVTAKQIQFTVTGLENGNVFSVSLRSNNSRGASNGTTVIEATPYGIPDSPIITGVSKNTRLDIVFDTPNPRGKPLVGYEYFVEPISSTYKRISSVLPLNDMSQNVFTIYGLTNGEIYTVNVRSVNGFGTSAVSNTIQISPSTTPEAPTIDQAVPLPGAINVVFNPVANTGGTTITGYKYAYYINNQ